MTSNPYVAPESLTQSALPARPRRSRWIEWLAVVAICGVLVALLLPAVRRGPGIRSGMRIQCKNNLKQIALALFNYSDTHGSLPPAYTVDSNGQPLHSWRTLILPYIEEQKLYNTIDLAKPWNDPVNAKARKMMPVIYSCPSTNLQDGQTTYLAIVAPGGCFGGTEPRKLSKIADGASNTLLVLEVDSDSAVHWMSPQDADESVVLRRGSNSKLSHSGGSNAALADGSIRFLGTPIAEAEVRALISVGGDDNDALPDDFKPL